jgi:hypothetical protein
MHEAADKTARHLHAKAAELEEKKKGTKKNQRER